MSFLGTLKAVFAASTQSPDRGTGANEVRGSYWCHDCGERIPAREGDDSTPDCPDCGDEMDLERSPGSTGCAC